MVVIRHDHEFVQFDLTESARQSFPLLPGNLPEPVQIHRTLHHLAKGPFPLSPGNGNGIRPRPGGIVPRQADGSVVVDSWVKKGIKYLVFFFQRMSLIFEFKKKLAQSRKNLHYS
jgi:hypothetical protein